MVRRIGNKVVDIADAVEARASGLDHRAHRDCFVTIRNLLRYHKPVHVCDVGANDGHWSRILSSLCSSIRHITFFEPQADLHDALRKFSVPGIQTSTFPIALDEEQSGGVLHGNAASASLFVPAEAQRRLFPGSVVDVDRPVSISTLDSVYAESKLPKPDLLKIDVQGAELGVLKGGVETLRETRMVVAEVSFQNLYESQPACWEVQRFLQERDFILVEWGYAWRAPSPPHELLQADGIFIRQSSVRNAT